MHDIKLSEEKTATLEEEIVQWHNQRFPDATSDEVAKKMFEEAREYRSEVEYLVADDTWFELVCDEFADVFITFKTTCRS